MPRPKAIPAASGLLLCAAAIALSMLWRLGRDSNAPRLPDSPPPPPSAASSPQAPEPAQHDGRIQIKESEARSQGKAADDQQNDPTAAEPEPLVVGRVLDFPDMRRRGLGDLPNDVMSFLCESLTKIEAEAERQLMDLQKRKEGKTTEWRVEDEMALADAEVGCTGAKAKTDAVLSGDYLLLPFGKGYPDSDRYHVVLAPGGEMAGVGYNTYIYVDLAKHPEFAAALRSYSRAADERDRQRRR